MDDGDLIGRARNELVDKLLEQMGLWSDDLDDEVKEEFCTFASKVAELCAARVVNLAKDRKHEGNDGQLRFANEASDAILTLFHCH
jgi:hypothetical protein